MKFEIKHDITGAILFEFETTSLRLCLQAAVKSYANLMGASLIGADFVGANLVGANLRDANLRGAKNANYAIALTRILPQGSIIGWKKAQGKIVKLRIPEEAKRSHAFGRKCRAEFVDVLDIEGSSTVKTTQYGFGAVYTVGQRTHADKWDDDFTNECSHGIHFFITREEAEAWD